MRNYIAMPGLWMAVLALYGMPYSTLAEQRNPSGIQGQAVVSPNLTIDGTGGFLSGGTPIQTHVTVLTAKGRFVTAFVTDPDGTFTVLLKPGDYLIVPDSPPNPYLFSVESPVQVHKKEFTTITIGYFDQPL
jgi:hypothetical protein